jgi:hypothetical protein
MIAREHCLYFAEAAYEVLISGMVFFKAGLKIAGMDS